MLVNIEVDTEALVVDAYPMLREANGMKLDQMDIAWAFYCAMRKRHPELVGAYAQRMMELIKAVRDIELSMYDNSPMRPYFTMDELNYKWGDSNEQT